MVALRSRRASLGRPDEQGDDPASGRGRLQLIGRPPRPGVGRRGGQGRRRGSFGKPGARFRLPLWDSFAVRFEGVRQGWPPVPVMGGSIHVERTPVFREVTCLAAPLATLPLRCPFLPGSIIRERSPPGWVSGRPGSSSRAADAPSKCVPAAPRRWRGRGALASRPSGRPSTACPGPCSPAPPRTPPRDAIRLVDRSVRSTKAPALGGSVTPGTRQP